MLIQLIALVAALCAVAYAWFIVEMGLAWRLVVTALVGTSLLFQLAPPVPVSFLVPLLMQVVVVIWMALRRQLG